MRETCCTTLTRRAVLLQNSLWIESGIANGIVNGGGGFPSDESGIFKGGLRGLQSVFCTGSVLRGLSGQRERTLFSHTHTQTHERT
jgi:hypothetical protein